MINTISNEFAVTHKGRAKLLVFLALVLTVCVSLHQHSSFVQGKEVMIAVENFDGNWGLAAQFCFDQKGGESGVLSWSNAGGSLAGLNVAIFSDEIGSLPEVKNDTCESFNVAPPAKAVIPLASNIDYKYSVELHDKPHYYYVFITACNQTSIDEVFLVLSFTNPGSWWERQFSKDVQGVPVIHVVFSVFYAVFGMIFLYVAIQYKRSRSFHAIIQLFTVCLCCQICGEFLAMFHFLTYAADGVGIPVILLTALLLRLFSELIFIYLILLFANGWTISSPTIHNKQIYFTLFITLGVLYFLLLMFGQLRSPVNYVYLFNTPPGIGIAVLRGLVVLVVLYSTYKTCKVEPESHKNKFYKLFAVGYSTWLLVLPLSLLFALAADPWNRYKFVEGFGLTAYFVAQAVMMVLLWPSWSFRLFTLTRSTAGSVPYENL